jgi:hypothetical protein
MCREKGNILFLILIAVALFAALSYAVTGSSRSGGHTISKDKAKIAAAEIVQYATQLEQAVTRLRVINKCTANQISFDLHQNTMKTSGGSDYNLNNPYAPSDFSCHVFRPEGGGVAPRLLPAHLVIDPALKPSGTLHPQAQLVSATAVQDVGSPEADLLLWYGSFSAELCMAINEYLGVENLATNPPEDTFICNSNPFRGVFGNCSANPLGNIPQLAGKRNYCAKWPGQDVYNIYYHVLMVR